MLLERLPLRDDREDVYVQFYWHAASPGLQAGRRRPLVIVCPGGGYQYTSDREAEPVALRFLARGFHAAVLRYSVLTPLPRPMQELARAILAARERADEHGLDPHQIYVCGFSAGGHVAAGLGVLWDQPELEARVVPPEAMRPDGLILAYAVIDLTTVDRPDLGLVSAVFGRPDPPPELVARYGLDQRVTPETPPAFIWHTAADQIVPAANALRFAAALDAQQVPYELHVFERGGHGLALADETTDTDGHLFNREAQVWVELAVAWVKLRSGS
jgi:acetyl esterase/lipase